ncbi:MAG TPA: hypothetical protein VG028_15525 [Terriglobia bacterium]|nr:hypothetical protein [Terriglobia bacterium]
MLCVGKAVRLNGKDYQIDSEEIRELSARLEPKTIDKYWVRIDGRRLPPKQVVSELLGVPLVEFTTMDATRVLSGAGFKVYSESEKAESVKTESEALLEEYLRAHGLIDFEFQPTVDGTLKRPDYLLHAGGEELFLEVKEFAATPEDLQFRFGAYDPYGPIREKIGAGRKKFKEMEGRCCCLVMHNHDKPLVSLDWQRVMGAMLGNVGFSFPVDTRTGEGDVSKMERVTLGGGKMHKHKDDAPISPQNTTISAVIVVESYGIGQKRFQLSVHEKEQELGRELSVEEYLDLAQRSAGTERDLSLNRIRVRVHENPYALVPLSRDLFMGPFDERYGKIENTGRWGQVFVGQGVAEFEQKSPAAKLLSKT